MNEASLTSPALSTQDYINAKNALACLYFFNQSQLTWEVLNQGAAIVPMQNSNMQIVERGSNAD